MPEKELIQIFQQQKIRPDQLLTSWLRLLQSFMPGAFRPFFFLEIFQHICRNIDDAVKREKRERNMNEEKQVIENIQEETNAKEETKERIQRVLSIVWIVVMLVILYLYKGQKPLEFLRELLRFLWL